MTETPENTKSAAANDNEFFSVGPPLHPVRGGYVRRRADDALYSTIVHGRYAHVIAPARTGKSSLIAATAAKLRNNGYKVATLDLTQITERDGGTDAGRWYYSIAYRLLRQLRIKIDLQDWWQDKAILSNRQRLVEFYIEVILQNVRDQIVVFVDEIQSVENLPFNEHLLPSIRAAHNARTADPELERISFVLCGECDPSSLISEPSLSPFDVSQPIQLPDFDRSDLDVFANELNLSTQDAAAALDRIWHWTSGQPYLCQKLCRALSRERGAGDVEKRVDRIVQQLCGGRAALHSEPHMQHIHRRIVRDRRDFEAMLNLYGRLRKGVDVLYEPASRPQRKLMACGLVTPADDGRLAIRNRLYELVFTARWANHHLPLHWRGPALATALVIALVAVPFWYTQLLPKPYMRVLVSPTLPLDTVSDSWRNLRSFPGHSETADRLYINLLGNRADLAADRNQIESIAERARELPGRESAANRLIAEFWDRESSRAKRLEDRDGALIAALEALVVATPQRRRAAAALIGSDYLQLVATLPATPGGQLLFSPRDMLVSNVNGARVSQWSLQNGQLQARDPWTISALEVAPLLRRVVVDREGLVSRIRLRVNVSHARLDDLRARLIAPSGRAVELVFERERSSANDEIAFNSEQLAGMQNEPISGTWSLSLRDEATGVSGHLLGWSLSLNSQVVVESFDRGLDIPAPLERESNNLWFSDDGRYAVARASQSDSARMWDLASARPARTVAVPADERVIGLSVDARYLVTAAQSNVHLWRLVTGRREAVLATELSGAELRLTGDGDHLLIVRRGEPETRFELWSLESRSQVAAMAIAGTPALVAIDRDGQRLAVADYDRAVRVWNLSDGTQLAQIGLHAQPSEMQMAADGETLAVTHGEQGVSLWRVDRPDSPVRLERGFDEWQMRFSPSGQRLLAGGKRRGFQVYRSTDGALVGPTLDPMASQAGAMLLSFSSDESMVVTASQSGSTRFWQLPAASELAAATDLAASNDESGHQLWRASGDSPAAVSPGGERLAIADNDGHVHILKVGASEAEIALAQDDLNFLGHQGPVTNIVFSNDGELVASAGVDGTIRIWNAGSGSPRPHYADIAASPVRDMSFSSDSTRLAVLAGQRVLVLDVESGDVQVDMALGELHTDMAFGHDQSLYLGTERGTLRRLGRDRGGNFSLQNVWQGSQPLRTIGASAALPLLVIVDANNNAVLLDLQNGRTGRAELQLPEAVNDVVFSPSDTRVLFRTARWVHRASVSSSGLIWTDAVRAPTPISGSRMVIDRLPAAGTRNPDQLMLEPLGDQVLLLTRDNGFAQVAELAFDNAHGTPVFGSRAELLDEWRRRLGLVAEPAVQPVSPPL